MDHVVGGELSFGYGTPVRFPITPPSPRSPTLIRLGFFLPGAPVLARVSCRPPVMRSAHNWRFPGV